MRYENEVISKNIEKKRKIKKVFIILLYLLLIPVVLFSVFLMILELGNSKEVPSFFNIEMYTVTSNSMSPKININDIILIKRGVSNENFKVGNIITYERKDGEIITHRIVEDTTADLVRAYITKGDNNDVEDSEIVEYDQIIGRVVLVMPKFGNFVRLLKNKMLFFSCILFLVLIVWYDIRNKNKILARKLVRERYEKKSDFYF